jgi:hypothetical protein
MTLSNSLMEIPIDEKYILELLVSHNHEVINKQHIRYFLKDVRTNERSVSAVIEGFIDLREEEIVSDRIDLEIYPKVKIFNRNYELSYPQLCKIVTYLGDNLPKGSYIMFSYSMITGETELHKSTWEALKKGIPASLTPIGELLINSGAISLKNLYHDEIALEDNKKLQGMIPSNKIDVRSKTKALMRKIEVFLDENRENQEPIFIDAFKRFDRIKKILLNKLETGI